MATKTTTRLEKLLSVCVGPSRYHNFSSLNAGWGGDIIFRPIKELAILHGGERGGSVGSPEMVPSLSKVHTISPEVAENAGLPWNLRRKASLNSVVGASGKAKRKFLSVFPGMWLHDIAPEKYKVE